MTSLPGAAARQSQTQAATAPVNADVSVFFANAATFPWRSHAQWYLGQMVRWGYIDPAADLAVAASAVFRPGLYAQAARSMGLAVPAATLKSEGQHREPWLLPAVPRPIPMGPDCFLDGACFDPEP